MPVKIHRLRPQEGGITRLTFCGKVGYPTRSPTEFDTADCNRFEATDGQGVTCSRCLKSAAIARA